MSLHLDEKALPTLLLVAAPVLAGASLGKALLLLAIIAIVRQIVVLRSRRASEELVLETLSVSHFSERVRWALDLLGEPYQERQCVGILGLLLFGRTVPVLHIPRRRISIGNSPDILRYLYGRHAEESRAAFLRPRTEAKAAEETIEQVALQLRRWLYYYVLVEPPPGREGRDTALRAWGRYQQAVPVWQRVLLVASFPLLRLVLLRILHVHRKGMNHALEKAKKCFDRMDAMLADGRSFLLRTEQPTYLDIMWASSAAPGVMPDLYGGKVLDEPTKLTLDDLPEEARREVLAFRARPSGKFVLEMYKRHRLP